MTHWRKRQRAAALVEFALAWPLTLLLVLGTVESAVWATEAYAARAASLAGARAASVTGGTAKGASDVTLRVLSASLVGVDPKAWCPDGTTAPPPVWVCATELGTAVEVDVGGAAPALVPMVPGGGLPIHAHVILQKEVFSP
jgi:Flp pilus assembly protein TadG